MHDDVGTSRKHQPALHARNVQEDEDECLLAPETQTEPRLGSRREGSESNGFFAPHLPALATLLVGFGPIKSVESALEPARGLGEGARACGYRSIPK